MYSTDYVIFVVFIILELCHIDSTAQINLLFPSLILALSSQIKASSYLYLRQSPKSLWTELWLRKKDLCDGLLMLGNMKAMCSIRED